MISVIHPSRSRPEQARETINKWIKRAGCYVDYILSMDKDDPLRTSYEMAVTTKNSDGRFIKAFSSQNRSAIDAINNAAKKADGDIFIQIADDFDCPEGWAVAIEGMTKYKSDWIAKTPDGIQKWIITLPIMDRAYYNRFGYIYHPDYLHMFCDTELTAVADLTGRKIDLNIPFVHNHYSTGKSVKDEVSIRADKTWEQGEKLFLERAKRNFDLVNPPGKITSVEYLNYLKSKGIR